MRNLFVLLNETMPPALLDPSLAAQDDGKVFYDDGEVLVIAHIFKTGNRQRLN